MAFRISRLPWMGGRPPGFTGGMSGFRCSHSGSVRSVSYGCRHVIRAHQHTRHTLFKRPLNHWKKLTLFLSQPGAPLDNNVVERALKKAILNRRNALFYKTINGAAVGDLFMSLIHTCELNRANPFDYLTELLRHAEELKQQRSAWMPWNYRQTLMRLQTPTPA